MVQIVSSNIIDVFNQLYNIEIALPGEEQKTIHGIGHSGDRTIVWLNCNNNDKCMIRILCKDNKIYGVNIQTLKHDGWSNEEIVHNTNAQQFNQAIQALENYITGPPLKGKSINKVKELLTEISYQLCIDMEDVNEYQSKKNQMPYMYTHEENVDDYNSKTMVNPDEVFLKLHLGDDGLHYGGRLKKQKPKKSKKYRNRKNKKSKKRR